MRRAVNNCNKPNAKNLPLPILHAENGSICAYTPPNRFLLHGGDTICNLECRQYQFNMRNLSIHQLLTFKPLTLPYAGRLALASASSNMSDLPSIASNSEKPHSTKTQRPRRSHQKKSRQKKSRQKRTIDAYNEERSLGLLHMRFFGVKIDPRVGACFCRASINSPFIKRSAASFFCLSSSAWGDKIRILVTTFF